MGPLIVGWMMDFIGANGFWLFTSVLMMAVAVYGLYRSTQRSRSEMDTETVPYAVVSASSTPIVAEVAQEVYIEAEEEVAAEETVQPL